MKLSLLLPMLIAVAVSTFAMADGRATLDEAKAMAEKAAVHYRQAGADAAFADFMKSPEWRDRDLYVFVTSNDNVMLVHAANPVLVGKNLKDLRDVDGKAFQQEMVGVKETGWVEYKWRNPISKAVEGKASYIIRLSADTILGVGAYK